MLCPFFSLLFTSGQKLGIFFFLLQNLHSSSPRRWLGDFVQKTCSFSSTLDHFTDQLLMIHLHPLLLLQFIPPTLPSQHCVFPFWVVTRFTVCSQQLTDPPTVVCVHSALWLDFLCQICHDLHPLLLPHLLFFRLAFLHPLPSLQIVFLNHAKIVAQHSSHPSSGPTADLFICMLLSCSPPLCTSPALLPLPSPTVSSTHYQFLSDWCSSIAPFLPYLWTPACCLSLPSSPWISPPPYFSSSTSLAPFLLLTLEILEVQVPFVPSHVPSPPKWFTDVSR